MVRRPAPLPPALGGAFTYASARELGVTRERLRHPQLHRPTRGLRLVSAEPELAVRAAAFLLVLPERAMFSHTTAAQLLDLPVPDDPQLHVMVGPGALVRRRGVVMHHGLETRACWKVHDLPVTSPVDTWLDLSAQLSVDDPVVLGDAILQHAPELAGQLSRAVTNARGKRGIRTARTGVDLIRPGVLSPQESLWRLRFHRAGFPEPELNVAVRDREGRWLGYGDFVWPQQRVVAEYDGDYHFTVEQRRKDQQRRRAMRDAGWIVLEINAADNRKPAAMLRTLGRALAIHP